MGRRGPPKTPTVVLKRRGSWLAPKRKKGEPKPPAGQPVCPTWLAPKAREIWAVVAERLDHMGVLTVADEQALATYCETWANWRALVEYLHKNGRQTEGKFGYRLRPEVREARDQLEILTRLSARFGLTPADRAGLSVNQEDRNKREKAAKRKLTSTG